MAPAILVTGRIWRAVRDGSATVPANLGGGPTWREYLEAKYR